ncbi:hypothetical protein NYA28ABAC_00340 [Salinicola sp. NYA28a]|jgi:chromate transporter
MENQTPRPAGLIREVFAAFLLLGLTSFGGPIAHLGYFRSEFFRMTRCRWLRDGRLCLAPWLLLTYFIQGAK